MNKSFFLLPLASLIITACSSSSPAPVVSATDSTSLPPSTMQPVAGSNGSTYGWQSEITPTTMPALSSNTSTAITVNSNPQIVDQPEQSITTTKVVKKTKTVLKKVNENFEIPRDSNNAPMYSQIKKGFYDGSTYTVRKGDTMFLIAYIIGKDVKEIAALNNMSEPYPLTVGQKLKTGKSATETVTVEETVTVPVKPQVTYQQGANGTTYASDGNITGPVKAGTGSENVNIPNNGIHASVGTVASAPTSTVSSTSGSVVATADTASAVQATTASTSTRTQTVSAPVSSFGWQWPTAGRVVAGFSSVEGGNKGIDIAGNKGQDVKAAADGKVVYAGNALEGYGNLIIIKHSDDFLSAYAHNDSIKVDEQDTVKAGEKIATMGSTGTNSNKLHFEIRYQGKSVDPTRYLPKK